MIMSNEAKSICVNDETSNTPKRRRRSLSVDSTPLSASELKALHMNTKINNVFCAADSHKQDDKLEREKNEREIMDELRVLLDAHKSFSHAKRLLESKIKEGRCSWLTSRLYAMLVKFLEHDKYSVLYQNDVLTFYGRVIVHTVQTKGSLLRALGSTKQWTNCFEKFLFFKNFFQAGKGSEMDSQHQNALFQAMLEICVHRECPQSVFEEAAFEIEKSGLRLRAPLRKRWHCDLRMAKLARHLKLVQNCWPKSDKNSSTLHHQARQRQEDAHPAYRKWNGQQSPKSSSSQENQHYPQQNLKKKSAPQSRALQNYDDLPRPFRQWNESLKNHNYNQPRCQHDLEAQWMNKRSGRNQISRWVYHRAVRNATGSQMDDQT